MQAKPNPNVRIFQQQACDFVLMVSEQPMIIPKSEFPIIGKLLKGLLGEESGTLTLENAMQRWRVFILRPDIWRFNGSSVEFSIRLFCYSDIQNKIATALANGLEMCKCGWPLQRRLERNFKTGMEEEKWECKQCQEGG